MKRFSTLLATALIMLGTAANAETYEVQMLNRGETGAMVFEPAFLHIQPGDTVRFIPTHPSHNAESIADLIPEGAEPFKGRINQEIDVTFTVDGAYAYKCAPHLAMGMVGLIVVGDSPTNLDMITDARLPKLARERLAPLIGLAQQK